MTYKRITGGRLIAFEGVDGSGKTTQAMMARSALEALGYEALYLREPTSGPYGRKLRELMQAGRDEVAPIEEFKLFLLDRQEDVAQNIRPALDRGALICIDRYYISSIAYQGALGLDPVFIQQENEKIAPVPDLILHFRVPISEGARRIQASREGGQNLFEAVAYQEQVAEMFEQMRFEQMVRIDASLDVEDVHRHVMQEIEKILVRG